MNLSDLKIIYFLSCIGLGLIILSPTLISIVQLGKGEMFSELWILGQDHELANYPSNVTPGENYQIYLGVGNNMGSLKHYKIYVKFRNQTEALPNLTTGIPSSLEPLCEFQTFIKNDETWEGSLTFSFSDVSFSENRSSVKNIVLNNHVLKVNKRAQWDIKNRGYYYQVFFELWLYDSNSNDFVFSNRFAALWLRIATA